MLCFEIFPYALLNLSPRFEKKPDHLFAIIFISIKYRKTQTNMTVFLLNMDQTHHICLLFYKDKEMDDVKYVDTHFRSNSNSLSAYYKVREMDGF